MDITESGALDVPQARAWMGDDVTVVGSMEDELDDVFDTIDSVDIVDQDDAQKGETSDGITIYQSHS